MERWKNRVAFVSGVSRGIGARICRQLVKHGMIVIGCAKSVALIEDIAKEERANDSPGELHAMKCDLSKEIEVLAMFNEIRSRFGRIDVCVNIAGYCTTSSFTVLGNGSLRNVLQEHIMALSICSMESLQLMNENNITDGIIIQVLQIGGTINGGETQIQALSDYSMYLGISFTIRAFAETLRRKLRNSGSGIRVMSIRPDLDTYYYRLRRDVSTSTAVDKFKEGKRFEAEVLAGRVFRILETQSDETVNDVVLSPEDFHKQGGNANLSKRSRNCMNELFSLNC